MDAERNNCFVPEHGQVAGIVLYKLFTLRRRMFLLAALGHLPIVSVPTSAPSPDVVTVDDVVDDNLEIVDLAIGLACSHCYWCCRIYQCAC